MYMKQMCNRKHARDLEEGKGKKQQVKRKKEKGIRKRVAAEQVIGSLRDKNKASSHKVRSKHECTVQKSPEIKQI